MYIHIDTYLDIDQTTLSNIGVQISNGFSEGRLPYRWKIISEKEIKSQFGDKDKVRDYLESIETTIKDIHAEIQ